jgi:hypothetical protein
MDERERSRRGVLRAGATLTSVVAVGGLAGCSDQIPDVVGGGGGQGVGLLGLVPEDANGAYYANIDAISEDEAIKTIFNAYLEQNAYSEEDPEDYEELQEQIQDETDLDVEAAEEMLAFGEYASDDGYAGFILNADWTEDDLVDGLEESGAEYDEDDHEGKTVYEQESEYSNSAMGVLAEGQFVFGTVDAVEDTIDVKTGNGDQLDEDLRNAFTNTRDAAVRFVSSVPEEQLETTGYDDEDEYEEEVGDETIDYSSVQDLEHSSGSIYADGDTRGMQINYEASDTDAAEEFEEVLNTLKEISEEESESDELDDQLENSTISRDGTTVTVTYETTVDEIEDAVDSATE